MSDNQPPETRVGRRLFLGSLGVGALAVGSGALLNPIVGALKATTRPSKVIAGFTIYTVAPIPTFHPKTWTLKVGGLVDKPQTYTYADLMALPSTSVVRNYQCVTGWIVDHLTWQGVSLQTLANLCKMRPGATFVNFYSADGVYSESLRLPDQAFKSDVMLGYNLNNAPLAREQGAPLRLVVPEMYGYKYAKWINRVEFSDRQELGYWERNGYTVDAYLGTEST